MQIDLANWFEIVAFVVILICGAFRLTKSTSLLLFILLITLVVEFTAKYLNLLYHANIKVVSIAYAKNSMYSLFNIIKFCGFSWFIYFLLEENSYRKWYLAVTCFISSFIMVNIMIGQGYKTYNNYSTVVGIICLTAIALYKLRNFDSLQLTGRKRLAILLYLCVILGYYALCLPTFLFFQLMFSKNTSKAIETYRLIIDTANYLFYTGLSLATILFTFANRANSNLQPAMT